MPYHNHTEIAYSYFQFQVNLTVNTFTVWNMSKLRYNFSPNKLYPSQNSLFTVLSHVSPGFHMGRGIISLFQLVLLVVVENSNSITIDMKLEHLNLTLVLHQSIDSRHSARVLNLQHISFLECQYHTIQKGSLLLHKIALH